MGSGRWSTDVYDAAARVRAATGTSAFAYSDGGARRVHDALNPFGVDMRESRDSDEHPQSLAIAVLFDVTGSMRRVPAVLQTKLPGLLGLVLRKDYVADPHIMFGAIGDATCDRVPLQVGQYESDNRMDEDLGRIVLEGGGGGQMTESYELAMYFMARHTSIDCFEKRGRRGYLFLIGDELPYPRVSAAQVRDIIGDDLEEDISTDAVLDELKRRYHVYYIPPGRVLVRPRRAGPGPLAQPGGPERHPARRPGRGVRDDRAHDRAGGGAIGLDEGLDHLVDVGSDAGATVGRALATIGRSHGTVVRGPALRSTGGADDGLIRL
jgi:hypothetical protein